MELAPDGIYVDVTLGGGGYAREILRHLGDAGRLVCFDQDADAIGNAPDDARCTAVRSNFRYLLNFLRYHDVEQVDAIVADLGVSGHHFDDTARGFTFRGTAPLDMRMNRSAHGTAAELLNTADEERLGWILRTYGEVAQWKRMAKLIVAARNKQPLVTADNLVAAVAPMLPPKGEKKVLAQLFQALRMEVNHEMDALGEKLLGAGEALKPGGRLVGITYHSLEDRLVKNVMRSGNMEGEVTKDFFGRVESPFVYRNSVVTPTAEELERNPRSRSAKLRVAVKRGEEGERDNRD